MRVALASPEIASIHEAVHVAWRDAREQARQESVDRERRAVRGRRVPFGISMAVEVSRSVSANLTRRFRRGLAPRLLYPRPCIQHLL
jgi:hypothetical protein